MNTKKTIITINSSLIAILVFAVFWGSLVSSFTNEELVNLDNPGLIQANQSIYMKTEDQIAYELTVANTDAGKQKSMACVACHGVNGNSVNPIWPKLAGQSAHYITLQLQYFKSGERVAPLMNGLAEGLSDQDILDIASYFSKQKVNAETYSGDDTSLELAKKLYKGGDIKRRIPACSGCHGPDGSGNDLAAYPRISGQHAEYLIQQLRKYKTAERKNPMMNTIASRLQDSEIIMIANYIQALY